jgi:hypothetical protein
MSLNEKELTSKERLKLLEDRREKGEISDDTYNTLKAEIESEMAPPPPAMESESIPLGTQPPKAKKFPVPTIIIVIAIVGIIIIAAAVTGVFKPTASSNDSKGKNEIDIEVTQWEDVETIEGDISGGGPGTVVPDAVESFEVENTVYQMDILLTWDPQGMDLDLIVKDSGGNERGTSGNAPGTPESIRIQSKIEPGTWTAEIDPFFAANIHYTLEITYFHESVNVSGIEGDLLYMQEKDLAGESGEENNTFEVGEEYESLFIHVEISSSEGTMSVDIMDPDGDTVHSGKVSGEDGDSHQETVSSKPGEWTVKHSIEEFTGTSLVLVVGS